MIQVPISPAASAYLEEAIEIMQKNGINRNKLDWSAVREKAFQQAEHAQTPAETYGAIMYVLVEAGGKHSGFLPPSEEAHVHQLAVSDSPPPRGKLLLDKLGYIAIGWFASVIPEEGVIYADSLQQIIRDLDAMQPCGWLVDLRENQGGNMWPMLAGIGPVLGEGKAGSFIDPDGNTVDWSYKAGKAMEGEEARIQVSEPPYQLKAANPPVAVITGINTASSGEVITVSFRGRPQTRSFGLYTAGFSTANASIPLSDGALLVLTTSVFADRTGQTYGDRVYPDEKVDDVRQFSMLMDEAIPQPAIDWLMAQPACAGQK